MPAKQCLDAALRLLGRKRYSRRQLMGELSTCGFAAAQIQSAIAKCQQWGYLNDTELALALIRQLQRKGFGPGYIRRTLNARELDPQAIEAAAQEMCSENNELEHCRWVLRRKAKTLVFCKDSLAARSKLYRFLFRRGFSSGVIYRVLQEFFESPD